MQLYLVLVCVEVINGVFHSVKRFDLQHSKFYLKREVQHPGCKRGFSLLYQGIHGDWSSALYHFLHVAELLLDVPEPLLPRPLPYFLLDGPIASVVPAMPFLVPTMPFLIAILSGGFVRIMLPILASLSLSICFSRRVEVLLFFLGDGVLAFLGLSHLLRVLHLPGELLQLSRQTLVGETECLHLVGIGMQSF